MQSTLHYPAPLQHDHYRAAWELAHMQHPALRLRFSSASEVMQVVEENVPLGWREVDASGVRTEGERQQVLHRIQQDNHSEGFNLESASLARVYLVSGPDTLSPCVFSCHHAILDGWSLPLLFDNLHETYLRLTRGEKPSPREDGTYMLAQKYLQRHRDTHLDFWAQHIDQVRERCHPNALLNDTSRYKVPLADYDHVLGQGQQSIRLPRDAAMTKLMDVCSGWA